MTKTGLTLAVSMILNVALVGIRGVEATRTATPLPDHPAHIDERQGAVCQQPASFQWEQLESPDYATYVSNLRAVGCPEQTVRDIIVADVENLYAAKKRNIQAACSEVKADVGGQEQLRMIEAEEARFIAQILAVRPTAEDAGTSTASQSADIKRSSASGDQVNQQRGVSDANHASLDGKVSSQVSKTIAETSISSEVESPLGTPDSKALYGWEPFNAQQIQALQSDEASSSVQ